MHGVGSKPESIKAVEFPRVRISFKVYLPHKSIIIFPIDEPKSCKMIFNYGLI